MTQENPETLAAEIIDCLMQSTRPIALLLGAGCPCAIIVEGGKPLIPDVPGLTKQVITVLEGGESVAAWKKLLFTFEEDGKKEFNIEEALSRIRGFREYVGKGEVRGLSDDQLEKLEQAICGHIVDVADKKLPATINPYSQMAMWLGGVERQVPAEIFTTNYDLLTEQALEREKVPFFDGFVGAVRPFFDSIGLKNESLPRKWIRVWKLHGSINWKRSNEKERVEIFRGEPGDGSVIHPSHLKYDESRKMPYLAMMDLLKAFIARPSSVFITVGYSFRDQHLNEVILEGLRGNSSGVMFGLLYGNLDAYPEAIDLALRHPNFRVHAEDGAIVGARRLGWSEKDVAPTTLIPGGIVEWTKVGKSEERFKPRFLMGHFALLGNLFSHIASRQGH